MDVLLMKQDNRLVAAYNSDLDKIKGLTAGQFYLCKITKPRNIKFNRKFFALLNLAFQNQDLFDDLDDMRHALIIEAGYFKMVPTLDGVLEPKALSMSFSAMEEDVFEDLYSKVLNVIVKWLKVEKQAVVDEIEQYF